MDLELRLLRHFVAVAEELHFSRAARRLFVAQQSLSRDVRRLEDQLGVQLLDRDTRSVALTPAGELLLSRARQLLAWHDETVRELRTGTAPCYVNVVGQRLTPARVLAAAREAAPEVEYAATFHARLETSVSLLSRHRLHAAFGRHSALAGPAVREMAHRMVRWEPLALLVPDGHRLAGRPGIPARDLRGLSLCAHAGTQAAPEWADAARQLAEAFGAELDGDHPPAHGVDEIAHRIRRHGTAVLTLVTQPAVPGAAVVPLVDPVPLYPWSLLWPRDTRHPGLEVLRATVARLARAEGWLDVPEDAWLPSPEADLPR